MSQCTVSVSQKLFSAITDDEFSGDQLIAKRRSERFKRIKCSTLARLLRESLAEESIY